MNDLNNFYEKHYNKNKVSWKLILFLILFSFLIYWVFSNYTLKEIFIFIQSFIENNLYLAYLLAFLAAVVEGTVILAMAPGTITILIFGALAAAGSINIFFLFPIIILGAVLGDNLGYFLGKYFRKKILATGLIDPLQYRIAEKFLKDHGGKAIALSRFINGMKELAPFIAGTVKMNQKRFQIFNFLGAIGWATLWLGLGYLFYENLEFVEKNIEKIFMIIGITFIYFGYRYYQKHKEELLK